MNNKPFIQEIFDILDKYGKSQHKETEIAIKREDWEIALALNDFLENYKQKIASKANKLPRIITECEKDSMEDRLLSVQEAATFARVSDTTIYDWSKKGKFPPRIINLIGGRHKIAFRLSDCLEWLKDPDGYQAPVAPENDEVEDMAAQIAEDAIINMESK
jgi:predicted DNA-binding transcriptional regulator AlpA